MTVSDRPASTPASSPAFVCQTWQWRGYSIRYTAHGTGEPLVLLHGFGASLDHWRKNIPAIADQGYQVFALDLLGFGRSQKPALKYSMDLWRDLVLDFWAEKIERPAVWVGNSIGALLALMLGAAAPEKTRGVALLNCAGGLNHRPEELNLPLRVVMGTFEKVVNNRILGPWMFDRVRQRDRIENTLKQVYGNKAAITPELVDLLYEPSCDEGAYPVFASILSAPPGPKPSELLPQIQAPILVLWGEADPWTPIKGADIYKNLAKAGDERIRFYSVAETGHCPHDERPEWVNQRLVRWMEKDVSDRVAA
ncbi:MAG: alpha/beta fold hydrolase [Cyanobacteria bacterium P01_H01_bin.130]